MRNQTTRPGKPLSAHRALMHLGLFLRFPALVRAQLRRELEVGTVRRALGIKVRVLIVGTARVAECAVVVEGGVCPLFRRLCLGSAILGRLTKALVARKVGAAVLGLVFVLLASLAVEDERGHDGGATGLAESVHCGGAGMTVEGGGVHGDGLRVEVGMRARGRGRTVCK